MTGVVLAVLNGACWVTSIFVMLRDIGAEGPVYCHSTALTPHVDISLMATNIKVGVALAGAVLVAGVGVVVVGVGRTVPGRMVPGRMDSWLMVDEAVEDETERLERKVARRGSERATLLR